MKFLRISAATIFFVTLLATNVQASIIVGDIADANAINTDNGFLVVDSSSFSVRSGRLDNGTTAANGSNTAAVFPFLLPDFGAVADPFSAATFTFELETPTNSNQDHTLYGLPSRTAATVLADDFHFGGTSGATTETSLQEDILVGGGGSPAGSYTSDDISSYLNTQYAGGANAGNFVFLRIAANGGNANFFNGTTNGAEITSADSNTNQPFIDFSSPFPITSVPEPGAIGIFGLALMGLGLRRRR